MEDQKTSRGAMDINIPVFDLTELPESEWIWFGQYLVYVYMTVFYVWMHNLGPLVKNNN